MKKEFIKLLKKHGLELISYDSFKTQFDYHNYDIWFKDSKGIKRFWDGFTDVHDKDENSINNKVGILKYFEKRLMTVK